MKKYIAVFFAAALMVCSCGTSRYSYYHDDYSRGPRPGYSYDGHDRYNPGPSDPTSEIREKKARVRQLERNLRNEKQTLKVLQGKASAMTYSGKPVWDGFGDIDL